MWCEDLESKIHVLSKVLTHLHDNAPSLVKVREDIIAIKFAESVVELLLLFDPSPLLGWKLWKYVDQLRILFLGEPYCGHAILLST